MSLLAPKTFEDKVRRPGHWVYEHYKFYCESKNKPMKKDVWLCPYFQTALFTLCVYKPIVVPFSMLIGRICDRIAQSIGPKVGHYDRAIRSSIFASKRFNAPGGGIFITGLGIAALFAIGAASYGMFGVCTTTFEMTCWTVFTILNVAAIVTTKILEKTYKSTNCKPEYITLGTFIATSVLINIFIPGAYGVVVWLAAKLAWVAVGAFATLLWWALKVMGIGIFCFVAANIFFVPFAALIILGGNQALKYEQKRAGDIIVSSYFVHSKFFDKVASRIVEELVFEQDLLMRNRIFAEYCDLQAGGACPKRVINAITMEVMNQTKIIPGLKVPRSEFYVTREAGVAMLDAYRNSFFDQKVIDIAVRNVLTEEKLISARTAKNTRVNNHTQCERLTKKVGEIIQPLLDRLENKIDHCTEVMSNIISFVVMMKKKACPQITLVEESGDENDTTES
jgi:hypothetical protein